MNIRRSFMAMGLAAATACLPVFAASGAIVSPISGSVAVNGQSVLAGSAVVPGDMVATDAAGTARMVLPGGSVIAASNTNFRIESVNHATQLQLNHGLVKVTGMLPVAVATRTVVPASVSTRFNVYDFSGKVYVEAVSGSVAVKSATGSYTVNAGKAVTFPDPQSPAPAADVAGGSGMPLGVAIGVAAAAAIVTGVVVHEATKCSNCVVSPAA